MKIIIYKPLVGEDSKRKAEYDRSRDICNRYTVEELRNWKTIDLYFVLGLDSMRDVHIPPHVLKFVYHKQTMKYHPDASRYPSEALFAVQRSYKVLGDSVLRRRYDSIYFDESLPEDRDYDTAEFLDVFSEVFGRNAKFSNVKPVPKLGSANTSRDEVLSFYKFWQSFDSWRSFELLYDDDIVMSRDERRFVEKGKRAQWAKKKNDDTFRVKRLVEVAMKRDPRINLTSARKVEVDPTLVTGGWDACEIALLTKLLKEVKIGQKNRYDIVTKRFNDEVPRRRSGKEIFVKCGQMNKN